MPELICPECNGTVWKQRKDQLIREYKSCANCGHAPFQDIMTTADERDARQWLETAIYSLSEARTDLVTAQAVVDDSPSPTIIQLATLRRAVAAVSKWEKRVKLGELMASVIDLDLEGQVLVHLPGEGVFTQICWGDYDLFKAPKRSSK